MYFLERIGKERNEPKPFVMRASKSPAIKAERTLGLRWPRRCKNGVWVLKPSSPKWQLFSFNPDNLRLFLNGFLTPGLSVFPECTRHRETWIPNSGSLAWFYYYSAGCCHRILDLRQKKKKSQRFSPILGAWDSDTGILIIKVTNCICILVYKS